MNITNVPARTSIVGKPGPSTNSAEYSKRSGGYSIPPKSSTPIISASYNGPQFQYVCPVEDPSIIAGLVQKALSGSITITQRELLAASPEVRKQVKELTTTKQFLNIQEAGQEVVSALTMLQCIGTAEPSGDEAFLQLQTMVTAITTDHENLVVASDFEKLRSLDITLEDSVGVECILDSRSQIVALRKEIWERLSAPVRSDLIMTMESANGTTDNTMEVIRNLKLSIGGHEFFVQCQVVKDARYDMLMGCPFFTLMESVTKDFKNGDQHLTMHDLNTGKMITVATKKRSDKKAAQKPGNRKDFP